MIRTPGKPAKHYCMEAINYHTRKTFVIFRKLKKRVQIAEFLRLMLEQYPGERIILARDNVNTHKDGEVEFPDRLKLLYTPTNSLWLNSIEMLWRHYRREVTRCELLSSKIDRGFKAFF